MTFGPVPLAAPGRARLPRDRRRAARLPGRRDVLALASLLLGYPDDDLCAARPRLGQAVAALPHSAAAADLAELQTWFAAAGPNELRVGYVRTFDHKRRSALYVTYAPYGDSRQRGLALSALRQRYHTAGFVENESELPDYLPTVLQFAALADEADTAAVLAEARTGIDLIERSLAAQKSPYAAVLRAVTRCLPLGEPTTQGAQA